MYFPYLYGRQGECRALEDVSAQLGKPQKVFPILEPVVESPTDLTRALDCLKRGGNQLYLIVNPSKHKLDTAVAVARWLSSFSAYLADATLVRPTFEVRSTTSMAELVAFFASYPNRPVGVSIRASQLSAAEIQNAAGTQHPQFFLHSAADPNGYATGLGAANCVEVRDSFRTEVRNADYLGEEKFTSEHLLFASDSRVGFSDYTLLPGKFNASGGPLGAAVIHTSFVDPSDNTLWVEHFVSDEVRQHFGSQPSKLMEAMKKLHDTTIATPNKFTTTPGIASYLAQYLARTPTSPTYNKRQQISHHIDTVRQAI